MASFRKINEIFALFGRYFLFIILAAALLLAFYFPGPGNSLRSLGLKWPLVVIIFFCQGLKLKTKELGRAKDILKILILGFAVSQLLAPIVGYLTAKIFRLEGENFIGFILICVMAPTLISGTVIAIKAGGSRSVALLLAVGGNLLAIPIIPINLHIFLGKLVPLPLGVLLLKLTGFVLIPALLGHFIQRWKPRWEERADPILPFIPLLAYGLLIYLLFSSYSQRITELTGGDLFSLSLASLLVHFFLMLVAFWSARLILHLREPDCRSLAMIASQKTPSLSIIVWAVTFADVYPLSIIPTLIFFLSFILADSFLAEIWSRSIVSPNRFYRDNKLPGFPE